QRARRDIGRPPRTIAGSAVSLSQTSDEALHLRTETSMYQRHQRLASGILGLTMESSSPRLRTPAAILAIAALSPNAVTPSVCWARDRRVWGAGFTRLAPGCQEREWRVGRRSRWPLAAGGG